MFCRFLHTSRRSGVLCASSDMFCRFPRTFWAARRSERAPAGGAVIALFLPLRRDANPSQTGRTSVPPERAGVSGEGGSQGLFGRGEVERAGRRRRVVGDGVADLAVLAVDRLHALPQRRLLTAEAE